jgi:hypothetical protein
VIEDEQRFGIIYTIDVDEDGKLEDWTTEEALIKANPNFGVSVDAEFLLAEQRDAIRDPRKQATFQTKHLNLWVQSASPWLPMHALEGLGDKSLKLEDFAGEPAGKASTSRTRPTSRRAARYSSARSTRASTGTRSGGITCRKRDRRAGEQALPGLAQAKAGSSRRRAA